MKPEIAKIWVDALRSGEYKQAKGKLATQDLKGNKEFCCLGILCELAIKNGIALDVKYNSYSDRFVYDNETQILPYKVMQWSGVKHNNGCYNTSHALSHDNDYGGTFETIANTIEEAVESL